MSKKRLALGVATVAVTAAVGLGVAAGPAAAAPRECKQMHIQSMRAALAMEDYLGVNDNLWNLAYDWWLAVENQMESNGC